MQLKVIVVAFILLYRERNSGGVRAFCSTASISIQTTERRSSKLSRIKRQGWVQRDDGEWEWEEDDPNYETPAIVSSTITPTNESSATPTLPSGRFRPKQSLGQNFLRDGNTVTKIIKAFHKDATLTRQVDPPVIVELGPGAGALTDPLVKTYGTNVLQCIEVDPRSVELLQEKHPSLTVHYEDVLQVDYPKMAEQQGQPLIIVGNLPYYITSQILFALADASHSGAVDSATVTMQWEVAQRMVAPTRSKDYGILSVVFQLYANVNLHFKIPPTVFYPQPKVDSALVGLHFLGPTRLRERLAGVNPAHLRRVVTTAFQQRRKTVRNSLKKLAQELYGANMSNIWTMQPTLPACIQEAVKRGDEFAATQDLPQDWASKRPEELTPGQFVELTRLLFGPANGGIDPSVPLGNKVWRKLKHGKNA
jgi:ribosomal RNA small subunit methyltransferase A